MYSDLDASFAKDFTRGLHLLHSTEPSSAEELRALLNASIVQRYGSEKIIPDQKKSQEDEDENVGSRKESEGSVFADSVRNTVGERNEVPRISIPELEQNNGLCKVCSVSEFGPLILIKCRKCGDLYHPLCHQPAVNVDAMATNFQWKCRECDVQTSMESSNKSKNCKAGKRINK